MARIEPERPPAEVGDDTHGHNFHYGPADAQRDEPDDTEDQQADQGGADAERNETDIEGTPSFHIG
jgi:hypothetical protein